MALDPAISPAGRLTLEQTADAPALDPATAHRIEAAFARGTGHGVLHLGAAEVRTPLLGGLGFLRDLGGLFVSRVCATPDADDSAEVSPPEGALERLVDEAPPMKGGEYLTSDVLLAVWEDAGAALRIELAESGDGLAAWLRARHAAWSLVGRVHFHLAEAKGDPDAPFAFLATYTARLSAQATAQHRPLGRAAREYSEAGDRTALLALLTPVQRAAERCEWLRLMVDSGEIFHPLRWTPAEAMALLRDAAALEESGVVLRMPASWPGRRPPRPRVSATVGQGPPSGLGVDAMLDFAVEVTLDGETLTDAEWRELLAGTDGLRMLRGRWVEVDKERLAEVMARFQATQVAAARGGLSFADAARLLAGADREEAPEAGADPAEWSGLAPGPWLAGVLAELRSPTAGGAGPGEALRATLRPYQQAGVTWLYTLSQLGLGGCLADDMGLGKTIQVLALLLRLGRPRPHLLVVPASLIANWVAEAQRFAPSLRLLVAHTSVTPQDELQAIDERRLAGVDVVVTSYGTVSRLGWLQATRFGCVVLDEAQAIKNPDTKQARAVKALRADCRLALTGTPVENRLGDLWSLFDFVNPGLLGTARQFGAFSKRLAERSCYAPLKELVRPYILRRLKTDKSVIADLPDKIEVKAFCPLSRVQAALYAESVNALAEQLQTLDGIQRRGVVLAFLMRFKQICNHPSQWLGDGAWAEGDSGKLARLRELCETIAEKQEKVLVFTQFRETTAPLAAFLAGVFGRPGLVLHGETRVKDRQELVRRFQGDESLPFFVLSLKAGGTGLNLTAASHVIHFDRWWNPAVENQATDRAFRIGQRRAVMVHKLVCRGTVEERIDALIESKQTLATDVLDAGGEPVLAELGKLGNEDLLRLVALDIRSATGEG